VSLFDETHNIKSQLTADVLRSSGVVRLKVTGWSMLPTVWPGDTLVVEQAASGQPVSGDIVLVLREGRLFAHRLIGEGAVDGDTEILTRGDAMLRTDPPVHKSGLVGKVTRIVRNGKSITPRRALRVSERAIAAVVRRSDLAARVVVGVHGLLQPTNVES
jgi:signal peptidase I